MNNVSIRNLSVSTNAIFLGDTSMNNVSIRNLSVSTNAIFSGDTSMNNVSIRNLSVSTNAIFSGDTSMNNVSVNNLSINNLSITNITITGTTIFGQYASTPTTIFSTNFNGYFNGIYNTSGVLELGSKTFQRQRLTYDGTGNMSMIWHASPTDYTREAGRFEIVGRNTGTALSRINGDLTIEFTTTTIKNNVIIDSLTVNNNTTTTGTLFVNNINTSSSNIDYKLWYNTTGGRILIGSDNINNTTNHEIGCNNGIVYIGNQAGRAADTRIHNNNNGAANNTVNIGNSRTDFNLCDFADFNKTINIATKATGTGNWVNIGTYGQTYLVLKGTSAELNGANGLTLASNDAMSLTATNGVTINSGVTINATTNINATLKTNTIDAYSTGSVNLNLFNNAANGAQIFLGPWEKTNETRIHLGRNNGPIEIANIDGRTYDVAIACASNFKAAINIATNSDTTSNTVSIGSSKTSVIFNGQLRVGGIYSDNTNDYNIGYTLKTDGTDVQGGVLSNGNFTTGVSSYLRYYNNTNPSRFTLTPGLWVITNRMTMGMQNQRSGQLNMLVRYLDENKSSTDIDSNSDMIYMGPSTGVSWNENSIFVTGFSHVVKVHKTKRVYPHILNYQVGGNPSFYVRTDEPGVCVQQTATRIA
jgi:hypothetical protein